METLMGNISRGVAAEGIEKKKMDQMREGEPNSVRYQSRRYRRSQIRNRNRNKKLYIATDSEISYYSIRAISLKYLLDCSCEFDESKGGRIITCLSCTGRRSVDAADDLREVATLCGPGHNIPAGMSCCLFGSQILFLGGVLYPWMSPDNINLGQKVCNEVAGKKVYVYDVTLNNNNNTINNITELDSSHSLTKYKHEKHYPRLVELNGDLYVLGFSAFKVHLVLHSEVYRSQLQQWEDLPEPVEGFATYNFSDTVHSYLFTEDRILVSKDQPPTPVQSYDVNRGCWITSRCSKPFPFGGWGLVVDHENSHKLVFAYDKKTFNITVRHLVLSDDNEQFDDSCLKIVGCVETKSLLRSSLLYGNQETGLVNLGDGKICFVVLTSHPNPNDRLNETLEKVSVTLRVFRYNYSPATFDFSYETLSTRCFRFIPHCMECFVSLLNCFVG